MTAAQILDPRSNIGEVKAEKKTAWFQDAVDFSQGCRFISAYLMYVFKDTDAEHGVER